MSTENLPEPSHLASRIHGCWLGKSVGGTLGLPAEGKMARLNFTYYDPVPTVAPPNDDLELQLVWLHLVEQAGSSLTQADFARAWLEHIHYMWDEYGRCRWNLRRGVPVERVGTYENPFASGMGSPIRSEIWACLFPGDPESAAHYAALDASLDHGPEGIAGEVFFAVMQSLVAGGRPVAVAIGAAREYLSAGSETARAIGFVLAGEASGAGAWECWEELLARFGNENFTHAPLNVALTVWALRYGGGDFEKSILLAVNGGYDTDCTAATVGATLGLGLGAEGIPARWVEPIGEGVFIGPGILGINAPKTLSELTERTLALLGKLEARTWDAARWEKAEGTCENLAELPGTIALTPLGAGETIPWANGELPVAIKQAGGGTWTWERETGEPREIICLARGGARLWIDGEPAIECAPSLPYVPATHRSAAGSRRTIHAGPGRHAVRVELASRSPEQEAAVMLAYPNLHLAPWTGDELPEAAILPVA